jgi:hypothetical protein
VVLTADGSVSTAKFPLTLECTLKVKELDSPSAPVVMTWKGTWQRPEKPLFHVFEQGIKIPAPNNAGAKPTPPPVLEAIPVSVILKDAAGKVVLNMSASREGPVAEVRPTSKGLSFRVAMAWETGGRTKVSMSLEPVE